MQNDIAAMNTGLEQLRSMPLCLRLIRNVHGVLMTDVRGHERSPGEFRTTPNWIGSATDKPEDAALVPPLPDEMRPLLDDLEQFLNEDAPLPVLVRCALVHYQFETIHPFLDSNGRLGRRGHSLRASVGRWRAIPAGNGDISEPHLRGRGRPPNSILHELSEGHCRKRAVVLWEVDRERTAGDAAELEGEPSKLRLIDVPWMDPVTDTVSLVVDASGGLPAAVTTWAVPSTRVVGAAVQPVAAAVGAAWDVLAPAPPADGIRGGRGVR